MPITLPSGVTLCLTGDAPIDPGENWFRCPPDHFWLQVAAPEMGEPLFDLNQQVWLAFEHAPIPHTRSEATKYARVCEMLSDGMATWRGE